MSEFSTSLIGGWTRIHPNKNSAFLTWNSTLKKLRHVMHRNKGPFFLRLYLYEPIILSLNLLFLPLDSGTLTLTLTPRIMFPTEIRCFLRKSIFCWSYLILAGPTGKCIACFMWYVPPRNWIPAVMELRQNYLSTAGIEPATIQWVRNGYSRMLYQLS